MRVVAERKQWKGRIDFLLASVGYHVGLGNVWRFPYLCYIHGGSAFLIPYIIMTLVAGLPLSFLEHSVGQFISQGSVTAWSMTPLLSGIGWASVLISAMVCVYYNVIIMYALLYLFLSLTNIGWEVPWASCDNRWNIKHLCLDKPLPDLKAIISAADKPSKHLEMIDFNCLNRVSDTLGIDGNISNLMMTIKDNFEAFENRFTQCRTKYSLPAQQFWTTYILQLSDEQDIGSLGSLTGRNVMFLLLTWIIVFFCINKGPRSIVKVVYFTATYPLGVLVVLLIRGLTVEGFNQGIDYYIVPRWDRLQNPGAWSAAATQAMFTLGITFGGNITLASYNKFNNNIFRDSMIIIAVDATVSIFAGFVTFSLIGFISHETNIPLMELIKSGPELVFVIYPQGLASLPSPAVWAFFYFLMVFSLGLDSQFGMMETIIVGVTDRFPNTVGKHRTKFVLLSCVVGFLLGLQLTTEGGMFVLNFINSFAATYAVMLMALLELFLITWIYGLKNFIRDLEHMLGRKHPIFWVYWGFMWMIVSPIVLVLMFVMAIYSYKPAEYNNKVIPQWVEAIGWLMVLAPLLCVLGRAFKLLFYKKIPIKEALKPSVFYRPRHEQELDLEDFVTATEDKEEVHKNDRKTNRNLHTEKDSGCYLTPFYVNSKYDSIIDCNCIHKSCRCNTRFSNIRIQERFFRDNDYLKARCDRNENLPVACPGVMPVFREDNDHFLHSTV